MATSTLLSPRVLEVAVRSHATPLLDRARSIAAHIRQQAVGTPNGDVVWLLDPIGPDSRPATLDPHLYSGSVGVAFFLAAVDHVQGTSEYRELVLRSTAPLQRKIASLAEDAERVRRSRIPIGGLVGIGSFIYGLVRIGQWTSEPDLVDAAHQATRLLTPERLRSDDQLDLVRGCAGTLLALLTLDKATPGLNDDGHTPLDLAWTCAEHLLERRVGPAGTPRAWPCEGASPRTGVAHGASGISHALLRMFARTGAEPLRAAALEGFAFERRMYDASKRNWWDARYGRPLQLQSWCFGAPGVALMRLHALATVDDAELREDLAVALDITREHRNEPVDHVCCGNMGRADILASAALVLGEPALLDDARALAGRVLERAPTEAEFGLIPPGTAPLLRLSLFRGVAGIGYTLLRLTYPDRLPSALSMQ